MARDECECESRGMEEAVVVVVVVQVKSGLGRSRRTGDGQVPTCTCSSRAALRQAAPPPPASTAPLKDDIAWGQKQRRSLTAACCCARHSAMSPGNDAPCDTEHVGCSLLLLQNTLFTRLHGARWVANTRTCGVRHWGLNSPFRLVLGSAGRASLVHTSIDVELEYTST